MIKAKKIFQQLPLLRNIIINKRTGSLFFRFKPEGDIQRISITQNKITGIEIDTYLPQLFTLPIYDYGWTSKITLTPDSYSDAITASVCGAIDQVQWPPKTLLTLKKSFSMLPAIQVVNRRPEIIWPDMKAYATLYNFAKRAENATPANFLNIAKDSDEETRYLKVLVMAYCLGLITSQPSQTSNIALRILERIRKV